jgi:folate-dependent phosphoribosylglycinamide formyltransferase PurN
MASKVSGCTVHFVDEELDHGAIVVQKTVPVLDSPTTNTRWQRAFLSRNTSLTPKRSGLCWKENSRLSADGW